MQTFLTWLGMDIQNSLLVKRPTRALSACPAHHAIFALITASNCAHGGSPSTRLTRKLRTTQSAEKQGWNVATGERPVMDARSQASNSRATALTTSETRRAVLRSG